MDRACFTVGLVLREGSFMGDKGMRMEVGINEDVAEVGWSAEFDGVEF